MSIKRECYLKTVTPCSKITLNSFKPWLYIIIIIKKYHVFLPGDFDVFPCEGHRACFVEYYYLFHLKEPELFFPNL